METKQAQYTVEDLKNYKIAVLCGGFSHEHDVSIMSGEAIYQALKNSALNLDVTKVDPTNYDLTKLKEDGFNLVFNTLHGQFGEDGIIQGFLEVLGIKYTGVRVEQSAITLNKVTTKKIWIASDVETAKMKVFSHKQVEQIIADPSSFDADKLIAELGLPLFVKPSIEGSSIGITKVKSVQDLFPAFKEAVKSEKSIIVEAFINGGEYSVPVLNGKALAAIQIIPNSSKYEFYNFEAKYYDDSTRYECPANLTPEQTARILDLAERASAACEIQSWCRVDILADKDFNFYALEINTNPGMTSHSLFPMAAKANGMSYEDLCLKVLVDAINGVEDQ